MELHYDYGNGHGIRSRRPAEILLTTAMTMTVGVCVCMLKRRTIVNDSWFIATIAEQT